MRIVFENGQVLVVDKPAHLVVNRSQTIKEETLQDQLAKHFRLDKDDLGIGNRAGIVHRLDRETSGLILIAKTQKSFEFLQGQFAMRQVKKEYLALVHGQVRGEEGSIQVTMARIGKFGKFGVLTKRESGGRETKTDFRVLARYEIRGEKLGEISRGFTKSRINYLKNHAQNYTYILVLPKTGRTHQIRVVLKQIGNPVVSDLIYAPSKLLKFDLAWCPRLFLHASCLQFLDPETDKTVSFRLDLPKDLENAMLNLEEV